MDLILDLKDLFECTALHWIRQSKPPSKMAAVTKNNNFFKWLKLLTLLALTELVEI